MFNLSPHPKQPLPAVWLMRLLLLALIVVALLAGYYQARLKLLQKKYIVLEQQQLHTAAELTNCQLQK